MVYFDTAYLAKCYLNEHGSDAVRKLASESARVACCSFGRLELAANIHRNLREGKISRDQCDVIFDQLDLDETNHIWTWLPVTPDLLAGAITKVRAMKPAIYLRAADALHLACAAAHGFKEIFSNDRHLLTAASTFKLNARDIIS